MDTQYPPVLWWTWDADKLRPREQSENESRAAIQSHSSFFSFTLTPLILPPSPSASTLLLLLAGEEEEEEGCRESTPYLPPFFTFFLPLSVSPSSLHSDSSTHQHTKTHHCCHWQENTHLHIPHTHKHTHTHAERHPQHRPRRPWTAAGEVSE